MKSQPIIECRGLHKWYSGVHALKGVNLKVDRGESIGLVGDNGAGKSTLIKILSGVHRQDQGDIVIEGRKVDIRTPKQAMKLGIDPIHFGIMMVVNMEVGMCHPPVGLNLYVASGITRMGITELTVAVWPWLLTMLVFLAVVTYWPAMSIWLPKALGML